MCWHWYYLLQTSLPKTPFKTIRKCLISNFAKPPALRWLVTQTSYFGFPNHVSFWHYLCFTLTWQSKLDVHNLVTPVPNKPSNEVLRDVIYCFTKKIGCVPHCFIVWEQGLLITITVHFSWVVVTPTDIKYHYHDKSLVWNLTSWYVSVLEGLKDEKGDS